MKLAQIISVLLVGLMLGAGLMAWSQEKDQWTYPVVQGYGPAWPLPSAAVQPQKGKTYRAVFDISKLGEKPTDPAPGLVHAARAYNVFAASGVPAGNMKIAIVMHGPGAIAAMNNETYRAKFNVDNPNAPLLAALKKAGAEIFLCGQSLHQLKFQESAMLPEVRLATSAMIVLVTYQNDGCAMMPF
jgi:intracellular sulfur oxidation DsrE/DsrF family protein